MPKLFSYKPFKSLAKRLVDRFTPDGNNAVWHKHEIVIPDASRDWETEVVPTEHSFRMVMIETRDRIEEFNLTDLLDETELQFDGTFAIFYPQEFDPKPDEFVTTTAGDKFSCKFVRKYAPERDVIAYIVGLS